MKVLKREGMIETTKTTRGLIVSICNYDHYQDPKNYRNDTEKARKPARNRQSNDTINNNDKNEKNIHMSEVADAPPDDLSIDQKWALAFWKVFVNNMKAINHKPTVLMDAKMGAWAENIRLMFKQDKRTNKELHEVYDFLKVDQFWRINCRSTKQLRDKFDDILIKVRAVKLSHQKQGQEQGPRDSAYRVLKFDD